MAAPGRLAQWLRRVAQPPTACAHGSGPAGAGPRAALLCPGAWDLWDPPEPVPGRARGLPGPPPSAWAWAGPRRATRPNAAEMPSASCLGASADGRAESAAPGVYGARTRDRVRRGPPLPPDGC